MQITLLHALVARPQKMTIVVEGVMINFLLAATMSLSPLAEQGKRVYQLNCVACHGATPDKEAFGPIIAGSNRALVEARVLRADYPAGYSPKRSTHYMPAFPGLASDIDAITAYLNAGSY